MSNYQLRNAVLEILLRIEKDQSFSHLLINQELKSKKLNPKDEGLLTEIVYGTLQRQITLDYFLSKFVDSKKKLDFWVKALLRMSLYQMVFLDRIPDHAIIHEAVEIAKRRGHRGISSFVNGVLRNIQRQGVPDTEEIQDPALRISVETSHPEWLVKRWIGTYGYETTKAMCETNVTRKLTAVRIQPLRINRDEAIRILTDQGFEVQASTLSKQGIVIIKGNILQTDLFKQGYVTIQDQSSMLAAEMLNVIPGMTVLDACSAPGGKVTHIAEKMENKGTIYAHDLHKKKTKLIDQKAEQLQLDIVNTSQADARQLQEQYELETFDRILVDAPCSGLGVIRGKPEIKYHKAEEDVERLAEIQLSILNSVAPLLKRNGLLIYSTCTVDAEENENVVKKFLSEHVDFHVDTEFFSDLPNSVRESEGISQYGFQLFPQNYNTDGFFLTRLIRTT
ncbi:16S rRNA (cytosine(967)-C(5))-methyltransferase RsmB [Virgibacillus halodenitrificans]|uniref:16S rRNA (cytosine(967)-C(5))-methyltransferase n=1 Tax=Virgibacillus halodenitrificans TaxID=1482 RepID=A0AAC9IZG7_VIRHA|nr:16S rRNA (cytosine(967)-C(5))-methyltransferase RsmB [Virgibacillus halodenitrificans]APC48681.1 16S rRNA (cytosine(967)-C(5))-methyltransferase [Virgibacillus halodenitrificans]MBD1224479.1 16S rRNA (cytosine(967)-C(5))-methyltransferase RsmB [Virgibacillus halodenitrificans]MCG1028649.1 16S rRNA (cytosine(967)-C(5))-methyltransferase RsmB [Virgibacillus halodenitrificans]MCJ0931257.1 16S rRNA (cytosine(967)-C(5))-methyltransferase RsmB [Virgibacillus halodenitrificans]MYL45911.1 16S rRNA 